MIYQELSRLIHTMFYPYVFTLWVIASIFMEDYIITGTSKSSKLLLNRDIFTECLVTLFMMSVLKNIPLWISYIGINTGDLNFILEPLIFTIFILLILAYNLYTIGLAAKSNKVNPVMAAIFIYVFSNILNKIYALIDKQLATNDDTNEQVSDTKLNKK